MLWIAAGPSPAPSPLYNVHVVGGGGGVPEWVAPAITVALFVLAQIFTLLYFISSREKADRQRYDLALRESCAKFIGIVGEASTGNAEDNVRSDLTRAYNELILLAPQALLERAQAIKLKTDLALAVGEGSTAEMFARFVATVNEIEEMLAEFVVRARETIGLGVAYHFRSGQPA